jgi:uncharacterized protein
VTDSIHITDIESAINFWRRKNEDGDGVSLSPQLRELATVYALMVWHCTIEIAASEMPAKAYAAWLAWYESTPDTPCIAICSTSQGDAHCKGCGRTFDEVQYWPELSPVQKRQTWRRITTEGLAWRFNRYAERAMENADERMASRLI